MAARLSFISYDDAYSPPKTVEQARKLVENDEVLLILGSLGTASNSAIQRYMNEKKVPQFMFNRCDEVERSETVSLDNGLATQLPERRSHLR